MQGTITGGIATVDIQTAMNYKPFAPAPVEGG
jgi:hypothetical protein